MRRGTRITKALIEEIDATPVESWSKIERDYRAAFALNTHPGCDFPSAHPGDIIDEDETVRWNREEVQRRIDAYNAEEQRLVAVKATAITAVADRAVRRIAIEAGISEAKARLVWDYAYSHYPEKELFNAIIELVDLIKRLIG